MENLPYDNLEELALVLQGVFFGDQLTVNKTQDTLTQMAKEPIRFTDALVRIITNETATQEFNKIKKAACISLERKLAHLFDKKGSNADIRGYILETTVQAIYSNNVPSSIKPTLQKFLKIIYHNEDKEGLLKKKSMAYAIEKMGTNQVNDYAASLLLIKVIIEDPMNPNDIVARWFIASIERLIVAGNALIEGVRSEIVDVVKGDVQHDKLSHIFVGLEVLNLWTRIIEEFIKRLGRNDPSDLTKPNYLDIVVDKEDLVLLLLKAMVLQIPAGEQIKECMFATSDLTQLDQLLNTLKRLVLRCFEYILEFRTDAITMALHSSSPVLHPELNRFFYHLKTDGVKAIIESLYNLSRAGYNYINQGLKDQAFHECICQSLVILTQLVSFHELYPLFAEYKNTVIIDICLPLIASTDEDIRMFRSDPQSFLSLTIGIHDEHETTNASAKLQAIYLLQKMCKNIDGATSAILLIAESLIEYSLHSNDVNAIAEQYPRLNDYKDSAVIKGIGPKIRVETSILILTGMKEELKERVDLIVTIDDLFTKYHEYFLSADGDPLIKSRVCLLFGSYSSVLFFRPHNEELYGKYVKFVMECVGITHEDEQGIVEQATDSIQEMLSERGSILRLVPFISDILEKLASYIPQTLCISFFDAINEILKIYSPTLKKTPAIIGIFVANLVERARLEYEVVRKSKGTPKLVLTKIWNIINGIGENKDFIPEFQEGIEKEMLPLFSFLETDDDLPFDDDILRYVNSTIKLSNKISPVIWNIFKLYPKIFDQRLSLVTPLFPSLNQIIVHGKDEIEGNSETIHTLVEMGIRGINTPHPDAGKSGPAMAALHFQILIQYVGIPNEEMERMLHACLAKLNVTEKLKGFLKVRIAGVFLLSFLRNFELTQAVLLDQNALGRIMDLFTKETLLFENHPYDRKVFLIGLCKFLTQPDANPIIVDRLPQILDILISYLKFVQHIDRDTAKYGKNRDLDYDSDEEKEGRLTNREILSIFLSGNSALDSLVDNSDDEVEDEDSDEESEEEDEEIYFPNEREEVNYYAKNLVAGIKDQDEFVAFREAIGKLKELNQQLLMKLTSGLDEKRKQHLKEIFQSQRVVVNPNEGSTLTRKMVKTVARKVANIKPPQ